MTSSFVNALASLDFILVSESLGRLVAVSNLRHSVIVIAIRLTGKCQAQEIVVCLLFLFVCCCFVFVCLSLLLLLLICFALK